jgi:hypothetical protein
MANMSYCRFHNTYLDLRDCANVIGEALDNGLTLNEFLKELSPDEQYYFNRLVTTAQDLIGFNHELQETV